MSLLYGDWLLQDYEEPSPCVQRVPVREEQPDQQREGEDGQADGEGEEDRHPGRLVELTDTFTHHERTDCFLADRAQLTVKTRRNNQYEKHNRYRS